MLTQEQQKLAEQYHGLIFSFAKEMRLSFEEWYGVLAIALCKAAAFYDPSKGYCFMTTAYLFMRRAVYHEWRKTRLQRYIPDSEIDSYNVVVIGPHGNPTEKIELLDSQMRNQKFDYTEIEVDEFRHQLTDLHRTVLDGLIKWF